MTSCRSAGRTSSFADRYQETGGEVSAVGIGDCGWGVGEVGGVARSFRNKAEM
ncbi:hypothetical protein I8748_28495 [Nostoc sp. CENA67]|uniref:Uncharacterized protein n=1 Tax=Amazonocrinis nigriterrae CENA67 TaxID=2794033 RepID=A0A8J7LC24_9NOST|nr:hypothetical protein [Amazonocrinis nigriterrae]MBH8566056.1 hypothetical protein [Amazonocrinis nigriterrae CENA67]